MIAITPKAVEKIREAMKEDKKDPEKSALRIYVQGGGCSGFQYGMIIDENGKTNNDKEFESNGVKILVDIISINYLRGAEVDFNESTGGFSVKNPNATSTCGCGQSFNIDENNSQ